MWIRRRYVYKKEKGFKGNMEEIGTEITWDISIAYGHVCAHRELIWLLNSESG